MKIESIVELCKHCGNEAHLKNVATYTYNGRYHYELGELAYDETITWNILQCSKCSKPTLQEYHRVRNKARVLYPLDKQLLVNLPKAIEKKYIAALKVQDIDPSACAVLVGRTLEAVCNHENAKGNTLANKLSSLVDSSRIPQTLANIAHQLREIRNLGAHDADDEVTEEDIPIIMEFLEAILEYLYVAPAKVAAVQARLRKTP